MRRVLQEGVAILSNDVLGGRRGRSSLITSRIKWLVCVPLPLFEKIIGVIYVDSAILDGLDEDYLQLVAAIARIAASALMLRAGWNG